MQTSDIRRLSERLGLGVRDVAMLEDRILLRLEGDELILPREPAELEIALRRYVRRQRST